MAGLDQARAHHDFATGLLPDLHASACMPCSDELNDASEQPGPLQTSPPASCSGRQARRPASSSGEGPLTSRARGSPTSKRTSIDFESTVGQPGTGAPLSHSIMPRAAHKQQRGGVVQAFQPGGLDSAAVASTAAVGPGAVSAAVPPTPSGGATRAGLPRGAASRQPGAKETAVQVVCHIRYNTAQQVKITHNLKRCRHGRPAGCCCVQGHNWLFELRPGMGPASRETDALHPWDEFEPLSVLCCRPKVSAEAVCKEKVRCSGNQVAIAGMDSSYNFDRCGQVSWFTNLRISASESTVVTLPDAEKPVVDCSSKASQLVLAAPVSNAKGSGSFKPRFQIAHTSCASF